MPARVDRSDPALGRTLLSRRATSPAVPVLSVETVRAIDDEPAIGDLVAVANERNTMPDCAAAEAATTDRRTAAAALPLPAGAERATCDAAPPGAALEPPEVPLAARDDAIGAGADIGVDRCPTGADHICRATAALPDVLPAAPTAALPDLLADAPPDADDGVDRVASFTVERRTT